MSKQPCPTVDLQQHGAVLSGRHGPVNIQQVAFGDISVSNIPINPHTYPSKPKGTGPVIGSYLMAQLTLAVSGYSCLKIIAKSGF